MMTKSVPWLACFGIAALSLLLNGEALFAICGTKPHAQACPLNHPPTCAAQLSPTPCNACVQCCQLYNEEWGVQSGTQQEESVVGQTPTNDKPCFTNWSCQWDSVLGCILKPGTEGTTQPKTINILNPNGCAH
jgi:hypothetical protein